jgi:hypothetical protein
MQAIKAKLLEIALAILTELGLILMAIAHGVQIFITWIIPSAIVSMVLVPDIVTKVQADPNLLIPFIVNAVLSALGEYLIPKYKAIKSKLEVTEVTSVG